MKCVNRLAFCLGGVLLTGCALPRMNSEWDESAYAGGANAGGTKQTAGAGNGASGTAVAASGQAGRTNNVGGTTASGGASFAGQSASIGSSSATGGVGGTSVTNGGVGPTSGGNASAGTSAMGGTSNTGGLPSVAGNKAAGGTSSSGGGTINVAGALSTGGAPTGGFSSGGAPTGGVSNLAGAPSGVAGAAGSSGKPVAIAIAAGWYHTCALLSDGTVRCWGDNCNGRLGDGGVASRCTSGPDPYSAAPIQVQGIAQATAIACGGYHTCVVDGGRVKCWGSNLWGQLGYSTTSAGSASPVSVGITTAKTVVAGQNHTCALLSDTSVICWGQNGSGQLGSNDSSSEVDIPNSQYVVDSANKVLKGVTKLTTIYEHTCAIASGGEVYCWGDNRSGELGTGTAANFSNVAVKATRLTSILGSLTPVVVGAGGDFSCALLSDGSARCWGSGSSGELGNKAALDSDNPVTVAFSSALPQASDLATGYGHACAVFTNATHTAQCWGLNTYGQIGGPNTGTSTATPVDVMTGTGASMTTLSQIQAVAAGHDHTCAIAGGVPYCWGDNEFGQLGTDDTASSNTARLVTGF